MAASHGVDQVIDADHLEVDVAASSVDQVIAADGEEISVAAVDHDLSLRAGEFQTGCEGNRAAMSGMEGIHVDVASDATGTTDSTDDRHVLDIDLGVDQRT